MSLVARGITNSVEIVRQTGLTRGEVELILTLHNLHIAPGPPVMPPSTIPGTGSGARYGHGASGPRVRGS